MAGSASARGRSKTCHADADVRCPIFISFFLVSKKILVEAAYVQPAATATEGRVKWTVGERSYLRFEKLKS